MVERPQLSWVAPESQEGAAITTGAAREGDAGHVYPPDREGPRRARAAGARVADRLPSGRRRAVGVPAGGRGPLDHRYERHAAGGQRWAWGADADSAQGGGAPADGVPAGCQRGAALSSRSHETRRPLRAGERRGLRRRRAERGAYIDPPWGPPPPRAKCCSSRTSRPSGRPTNDSSLPATSWRSPPAEPRRSGCSRTSSPTSWSSTCACPTPTA